MTFSLGSVMSRGLSVYAKNIVPFTGLAVLAYSPVLVYFTLLRTGSVDYSDAGVATMAVLATVMDIAVTAVLMHATVDTLKGGSASMTASLATGLRRILPVLGTAILAGLVIALGTLAFIVPGLIAMCLLWVAVPATVVERSGVIDSLSRSADLTEGYRWPIFGIVVILALVDNVPDKVLEKAFEAGSVSLDVYLWVPLAISIVVGVVGSTMAAVGYYELRQTKEDIELEELAAVFD